MVTNPSLAIEHHTSDAALAGTEAPRRSALRALGAMVVWIIEGIFGTASLVVGLSVVATIPGVQLLSLGYLLEVSGRVARERSLSAGFVGVRQAARWGRIAVGILLLLIPLWIADTLRVSAQLIDPTSRALRGWDLTVTVLSALALFQIVAGCLRGGKIRHFLWPRPIQSLRLMLDPHLFTRMRVALGDALAELRLPYYFWLGLRGFLGAMVWLVVPISLLALASRLRPGPGVVAGLTGGALLTLVLLHLPFLQARLAAMFELRALRARFVRAPLAFFAALCCTLVLALPLYLLKIEIVPREAAWLPSLLFVTSMFPARLMAGWALARSARRATPRFWLFRFGSRMAMLPLAMAYVLVVYFTQYLSWHGVWSLYEQHAFLVPVPFLEF